MRQTLEHLRHFGWLEDDPNEHLALLLDGQCHQSPPPLGLLRSA